MKDLQLMNEKEMNFIFNDISTFLGYLMPNPSF